MEQREGCVTMTAPNNPARSKGV